MSLTSASSATQMPPVAPVAPAGRSGAAPPRSRQRLRVVAPPARVASRMPFAVICALVLIGGLVGLLLLNVSLAKGAYVSHDLKVASVQLAEHEQALNQQVALAAAPQQLEARARALGMVEAPSPAFIRLEDGTVLGVPQVAAAQVEPTVVLPLAPTQPAGASTPTPTPATDTGD